MTNIKKTIKTDIMTVKDIQKHTIYINLPSINLIADLPKINEFIENTKHKIYAKGEVLIKSEWMQCNFHLCKFVCSDSIIFEVKQDYSIDNFNETTNEDDIMENNRVIRNFQPFDMEKLANDIVSYFKFCLRTEGFTVDEVETTIS